LGELVEKRRPGAVDSEQRQVVLDRLLGMAGRRLLEAEPAEQRGETLVDAIGANEYRGAHDRGDHEREHDRGIHIGIDVSQLDAEECDHQAEPEMGASFVDARVAVRRSSPADTAGGA
jgi:hypothetical protein